MDGNWGGTSGTSEMLLQSQDGFIHLLPALPDSWKDGSFYGLKVRGGATVDLVWKDGKPVQATITGGWQNNLKMKWPKGVKKSTPQRYSLSHRLFHPVHYKTRRMYYVHIRITDKQTITTKK